MSQKPSTSPSAAANSSVGVAPPGNTSTSNDDAAVSESFMNLTPEEQDQLREEWRKELLEVEYEIETMKQVLASKSLKAHDLKRKLGITVWKELQDDLSQGLKTVTESATFHTIEEKVEEVSRVITSAPLYQKTETAIKSTAEKTTSFLGGLGTNLTAKLGQVKNSETFRSLEEKVGSAYTSVKSKVVTSRSSSSHELDEALKEAEAQQREAAGNNGSSSTATPTTTPTQTDKPIA